VGDIVLLAGVFQRLRRYWPEARIAACVDPAYRELMKLHPAIDATLVMPVRVADWPRFLFQLRRERFTHVLDFDNRPRTALITALSGAGMRATLRDGQPPRLGWCYHHRLAVEPGFVAAHHITEFYHQLPRSLGVAVASEPARLVALAHELAAVEKLSTLAALPAGVPRLLVHPGSRSPFRIWSAEAFAAVCDRIQRAGLARVIFVAGPAEQDVVAGITAKMTTPAVALDHAFSLTELAALFARVDLLLCHDSGPMHLAAAVGTRVVALYGSQNITNWHPLGDGHATLQPPLPCRDCVSPGVCRPDEPYFNHCVRKIPVDEVFAALAARLPAAGRSPSAA
jgi:ADP-heptose:LPS heptosyltransferase